MGPLYHSQKQKASFWNFGADMCPSSGKIHFFSLSRTAQNYFASICQTIRKSMNLDFWLNLAIRLRINLGWPSLSLVGNTVLPISYDVVLPSLRNSDVKFFGNLHQSRDVSSCPSPERKISKIFIYSKGPNSSHSCSFVNVAYWFLGNLGSKSIIDSRSLRCFSSESQIDELYIQQRPYEHVFARLAASLSLSKLQIERCRQFFCLRSVTLS